MMRIELIFVIFALVGAIDKLTGNRFKLGTAFEKGIMTSGALILSMSGLMVLSPFIASVLSSVFGGVLERMQIDLSAVAILFPIDAGGASIAYEVSSNEYLRAYYGIIVASMFGATISAIPLVLQIADKKNHKDVLLGLLCGFATIPFGCVIAGILMGCPMGELFVQTLPIIVMSGIIVIGLWKWSSITQKVFYIFGKFLMALVMIGLCIGMVHQMLGIALLPGIAPLSDSFEIVGNIAVLLAGVFPMIEIMRWILKKPLKSIGKRMHFGDTSVLGLLMTLANAIAMFAMLDKMDKKGRILNMAFCVSAGCLIGDHLAFVLAFDRKYALPMIVGKMVSAIFALIFSAILYQRMEN